MPSAIGQKARYHWLATEQNWPAHPEKTQPGSIGAFLNQAPERYIAIGTRILLSHRGMGTSEKLTEQNAQLWQN